MNFHKNAPVAPLLAACVERGVKITFGSDTHILWEVGNFGAYFDLLREVTGSDEVLPFLYRPQ
jgi:histidinol phosphatase-like PHP family hydrolase